MPEQQILLYTDIESPRLDYTIETISQWSNFSFTVCKDENNFNNSEGKKIFYSDSKSGENFLRAVPALFQKGAKEFTIETGSFDGNVFPFFHADGNSLLPFDPFAVVFFLLSRIEEYDGEKDELGRFLPEASFSGKTGQIEKPIADIAFRLLLEKVVVKEKAQFFEKAEFSITPTIDVDIAWAYKNRPTWRQKASYFKDLLKGNTDRIKTRKNVLSGLLEDPYYTFPYISETIKSYKREALFFFLLADYGENNKNIAHTNEELRSLIRTLGKDFQAGIHPGFQSYLSEATIKEEVSRLENILKEQVIHSRQHYLRFQLPETYRFLTENGIQHDYSMGYASAPGFRAGTAHDFLFYDCLTERKLPLRIHPLIWMEGSFADYLAQDAMQALKKGKELIAEIKKYGGNFIMLWHNQSLAEEYQGESWRFAFEELLNSKEE